ncbi:MAG: hypothetical protein JO264_21185 [Acidisphaera sp.]|nr:hypothetical protein [Acidisphaera sp.]
MSEARSAAAAQALTGQAQPDQAQPGQGATGPRLITELKVSGHLMSLDSGLFCIVQTPSTPRADDGTGLPGVRVSLPPGPISRPEAVSITSFRPDGWMNGAADAVLVRVHGGPAQVLVTIYQAPSGIDTAPRLQVLRLADDAGAQPFMPAPAPAGLGAQRGGGRGQPRQLPEVVAHIQRQGDVGASLGTWIGQKGSKRWIEGFVLTPQKGVSPKDLEYQAVLGRGWLSPWVEGGQLCGSRGMALPILGLRVRLRGEAAENFDCSYSATFVDGSEIGPVGPGEPCEAESLAPMEAFEVSIRRRGEAAEPAPQKPRQAARSRPAAPRPPEPPPMPRGRSAPVPAGRSKAGAPGRRAR